MKHAFFVAVLAVSVSGAAFAHPNPPTATESSNPDKIECKRLAVTGSLVKGSKVCKTRKTWQAEIELTRRSAREMQDHGLVNSVASH